jgi:hypothetical protein
MDLLNSENLDTNVAGILSNMSGRKGYSVRDAKFQPFVMYRNADGEVVLSSESVLAPAGNTSTSGDQLTTPTLSTAPTSGDQLTTPILSTAPTPSPLEGITTPTLSTAPTPSPLEGITTPTLSTAPAPIPNTAPTTIPTTAPTVFEQLTLPNLSAAPTPSPTTVQPIIINNTPSAPTTFPVSTSSIPRTSMPMGGSGGGSGGGGGVAPSELEEIAKTTEEIAKKGMSNGAKLAIFGLLAVGGYFAWKYRDMIFKK